MKTPQEKYNNDPLYQHLVDTIENTIHKAIFTPSEIREAALLACIHYEERVTVRAPYIYPKEIEDALKTMERFRVGKE